MENGKSYKFFRWLFLIVFSVSGLLACTAFKTPAPSEAQYGAELTPRKHVDLLIAEGRYNEALRVILSSSEMLRVKETNAKKLVEFIERSPGASEVVEASSLFHQPITYNSPGWAYARMALAQGQAILKIAERAGEPEGPWFTKFADDFSQYRNSWFAQIPHILAICELDSVLACLEAYPVDLSQLPGSERKSALIAIVEHQDFGGDSVVAFSHYLKLTEDLFSWFFRTSRRDMTVIPLTWIAVGEYPLANQLPNVYEAFAGTEKASYADFKVPDTRFSLTGVVISDKSRIIDKNEKMVQSEYVSTNQSRPNPEYQRLQIELNQARYQSEMTQDSLKNTQGSFSAGFAKGQAIGAQANVRRLYERLRSTSSDINEKVYAPYSYVERNYSVVREIRWQIYLVDRELDQIWTKAVSWSSPLEFVVNQGAHSTDPHSSRSSTTSARAVKSIFEPKAEISLNVQFADHAGFSQVFLGIGPEIQGVLTSLGERDFVYLSSSDFESEESVAHLSNRPKNPSPDYPMGEYLLKDRAQNGAILTLNDGSVWEIDGIDQIYTRFWMPHTLIMVVDSSYGYTLINMDDGEKASASLLGRR